MLSGGETPQSYSPKVLTQIPMRYLLDHAHRFQRKYSTLYPTLLKLTAIQFPQLCLVCEWLMEKRDISGMIIQNIVMIAGWCKCY